MERRYYSVHGSTYDVVARYINGIEASRAAVAEVAKRYGSTNAFSNEGFVYLNGTESNRVDPDGALRKTPLKVRDTKGILDTVDLWVPDRRRKAGKALGDELDSLAAPSDMALTTELAGGPFVYMQGNQIWCIRAEDLGGYYVIVLPEHGPEIAHTTQIRASLYWKLKEDLKDRARAST